MKWKSVATPLLAAAPLWLGAMIGGASASADVVQMTSINGDYDPNHAQTLTVQPGDMITLSADLFNTQNGDTADGADVEDFTWQADDSTTDVCEASSSDDCLADSNFQVSDYGVSFYVPYNMGQQITIYVTSNDQNADANSFDSIVLTNANYNAGYVAPPVVAITDPSDYNQNSFDPDYAVYGQGNWVYINGDRYWAPNTYALEAGAEWVPYQNGYWTFSAGFGWTWVSYDPWGWATDHYGVWRFHESYGWVWRPFEDRHYEPNCVTFYYNGNYTGWYPYHAEYAAGYRDGFDRGFRDGFGAGENAVEGYGEAGYRFHPGFSIVENRDFSRANIRDGLFNASFVENGRETFRNSAEMQVVIRESYTTRTFSEFPGGRDIESSRTFMETRVGTIEVTKTETIRSSGGAQIMRPAPLRPVPASYEAIGKAQPGSRPRPVGTVVNLSNGKPVFVPPTTNGRGIVAPPMAKNPNGGRPIVLPPRAKTPAAPQPGNPVTGTHQATPKPPAQKPVQGLPGFNGSKPRPPGPAPRPVNPAPKPAPKPAPMPEPKPAPMPKPQPAPRPQPVAPAPRPRPVPPVYNPPAPRPQPVAPAPRPRPVPPVYNPPAPRPQPVAPAPRPRPVPPVYNPPAPRPQPAPRPEPAPSNGGGEHGGGEGGSHKK